MLFPEKYRFVSLTGVPLASGTEILFRFNRPLPLPLVTPDLITTNHVPCINLWRTAAAPFDVDGRSLEYRVRVDALRYRSVECHSVESVDLYQAAGAQPLRLDPVVAMGNVSGTDVRWCVRRTESRTGGEGADLLPGSRLQRRRARADAGCAQRAREQSGHREARAGRRRARAGRRAWRLAWRHGDGTHAVPACAHGVGIHGKADRLPSEQHERACGGESAGACSRTTCDASPAVRTQAGIDGIEGVSFRNTLAIRQSEPQIGMAVVIGFNSQGYPTASRALIRRVLGQLFESQRGLNRVQDVVIS